MSPNRDNLSSIIREYLPSHIRSEKEYKVFVAFIEAFYEFLDKENNAGGLTRDMKYIMDIDKTFDVFLDEWTKTLAEHLPSNIKGDKRFILKRMKEVYQAKGTEKSFQLLFRLLFDSEIDIRYPGEQVLIASGGNWGEYQILLIKGMTGDTDTETFPIIKGKESNASAYAERVETILTSEGTITRIRIYRESLDGEFEEGEGVTLGDAEGTLHTVSEPVGHYRSEHGLLSSNYSFLHDGFYYQRFSMVAEEGVGQDTDALNAISEHVAYWREIAKDMLKPAGTILFGERKMYEVVEVDADLSVHSSIEQSAD